MKRMLLLGAAALLTFNSCDKNNSEPDPNTGGNGSGNGLAATYSAQFNFNGTQTKLGYSKEYGQLVSSYAYNAGGIATNSVNFVMPFPSLELTFSFDHPISESDMMALEGQDIFQTDNGSGIQTYIYHEPNQNESWSFSSNADASYFVHVTDVAYSHSTTTIFNDVDVYRVKGYGRVLLENDATLDEKSMENLQFDMLISRVK